MFAIAALPNAARLSSTFLNNTTLQCRRDKCTYLKPSIVTCSDKGREELPVNSLGRRDICNIAAAALAGWAVAPFPAEAIGFTKELKKKREGSQYPLEDYSTLPENGLKYFDKVVGTGEEAANGDAAQVHFDCYFRSIDVVSSRSARLLGGNRTIAEPYDLTVGKVVKGRRQASADSPGGGLYVGGTLKAPPALFKAVQGMKVGGQRTVIVTPELGFGDKGYAEIPPGASFTLDIELLQLNKAGARD